MELNTKQALSVNVEEGATGIHYFKGDETAEVTTADRELMAKIREFARQKKGVIIDERYAFFLYNEDIIYIYMTQMIKSPKKIIIIILKILIILLLKKFISN